MNMLSAVKELNINAVAKPAESNPRWIEDDTVCWLDQGVWTYYHWNVSLTFDGRELTIPHTNVTGAVPSVDGVLDDLIGCCLEVEDRDFLEWAEDCGLKPKSKSAKTAYRVLIEQRKELIKFFGDDAFNILCNTQC